MIAMRALDFQYETASPEEKLNCGKYFYCTGFQWSPL
jgi:hypothetical protein